jgi:hypothetical protein
MRDVYQIHEEQYYFDRLTTTIDNINDEQHITPEYLYNALWADIDQLRHDQNREALLENWKYKTEFYIAEENHKNEQKTCPSVTWAQSFTMFFYLCIYH